jgi:glycine/D-amino acid oxidase-like deaminating enzyme
VKKVDYLIIGQGIAGSVLALTLLQRGRTVAVIDEPRLSSSSKVAAGAFNPFNFRKMVNNWRAEELTGFAFRFYPEAEEFLGGASLLYPRRVLKVFASEGERKLWEKACAEKEQRFAHSGILENYFAEIVYAPFGMGIVKEAGNIDTGTLMYAVAEKLKESGSYFSELFAAEKLLVSSETAVYDQRIKASRVVFCEGHLGRTNPWFGQLPIRPVKGQVLHVHIPGLKTSDIINRGVYLLPQGEDLFTAGATFENDIDDETNTAAAEEELLGKLHKFIRVPIRVESRYAGIRPAVKDRRPLLGVHPVFSPLAVFNGLGSKGVLLAPWLAEQLVLHLEEGNALPEEVRAGRFAN